MRLWKDTQKKVPMTDWQKINLVKSNMIKISEEVSESLFQAGITRPIIMGVILNGIKVINKKAKLTAYFFLDYVVILESRKVLSAFYGGTHED
jgi:hypothetical protein